MPEPDVIDGEVVEEEQNVAALAVPSRGDALVRPAASLADIETAFHDYQDLTRKLLDEGDYQEFVERGVKRKFKKKSAWRKLSVAFGVSFEQRDKVVVRERPDDETSPVLRAEFTYRAVAPNGRFVDGWGSCAASETRFDKVRTAGGGVAGKNEHDLIATAETRAKNRAASDLFGMGEVSAEEVAGGGSESDASARTDTEKATPQQVKLLNVLAKELGAETDAKRHNMASRVLERTVRSYKQLTKAEASTLIERWQAEKETPGEGADSAQAMGKRESRSEPSPGSTGAGEDAGADAGVSGSSQDASSSPASGTEDLERELTEALESAFPGRRRTAAAFLKSWMKRHQAEDITDLSEDQVAELFDVLAQRAQEANG